MDLLLILRGARELIAWYVGDLVVSLAAVTATFLLAERFDGIGSWSKDEILFMLGFGLIARGSVEFFFGWNIAAISRRLGRGQLDHTLVQPQPLAVSLLTEGFSPFSGSGTAIAGAALFAYALIRLEIGISAAWLATVTVNLLASCSILMSFTYVWGSLAFWAPRGAEEINSQTMRLMDELRAFPLDGVGMALQLGLLSFVPVGFVAWFPARALLGPSTALELSVAPLAAAALGLLALGVFRKGLEQYGRTGSVRYLDHGHRR